jgi:hypothetical protein
LGNLRTDFQSNWARSEGMGKVSELLPSKHKAPSSNPSTIATTTTKTMEFRVTGLTYIPIKGA